MHLVLLTALTSIAALVQQIDTPLGIERAVSPRIVLRSVGLTWSFAMSFLVGKGLHQTQQCSMMHA